MPFDATAGGSIGAPDSMERGGIGGGGLQPWSFGTVPTNGTALPSAPGGPTFPLVFGPPDIYAYAGLGPYSLTRTAYGSYFQAYADGIRLPLVSYTVSSDGTSVSFNAPFFNTNVIQIILDYSSKGT